MQTTEHRIAILPDRSERPAPPGPRRRRRVLIPLLIGAALLAATVVAEEVRIHRLNDRITGSVLSTELVGAAPLADGPHDVRIYMVGALQTPPMIAVDDEAIFVEDDAVGAAIEDGMAPDAARARYANEYSYYFRNSDPGWRILPVAADAVVTLETWRPLDGNTATAQISLQRFGRIYNGTAAGAHHFRWQHYEIVVEGGEVVRIQELNLMA